MHCFITARTVDVFTPFTAVLRLFPVYRCFILLRAVLFPGLPHVYRVYRMFTVFRVTPCYTVLLRLPLFYRVLPLVFAVYALLPHRYRTLTH